MPNVDFEGSTHVMKLVTFEKDGRSTVGLLNADGTAAVDFKCYELHRAALPPRFVPGSECVRRK